MTVFVTTPRPRTTTPTPQPPASPREAGASREERSAAERYGVPLAMLLAAVDQVRSYREANAGRSGLGTLGRWVLAAERAEQVARELVPDDRLPQVLLHLSAL